jgi:replicative DNA helicase
VKYDPEQVRAWAARAPQPEIERRVLGAIVCEPDKLARATDLEIDDFVDVANHHVFTAVRNMQAGGIEITAVGIAEHLAMQAVRKGARPDDIADLHNKFLDALVVLITAPTYEIAFGDAALDVFDADLRQLRAIAQEMRRG